MDHKNSKDHTKEYKNGDQVRNISSYNFAIIQKPTWNLSVVTVVVCMGGNKRKNTTSMTL